MLHRTLLPMALAAALLAFAGCMSRAGAPQPDMHTSRNAVDWAGTYEGVLPCADCPGIQMRLVLQGDGRFDLSAQYLDRDAAPRSSSGRFSWNAEGSAVTLDAAGAGQQFRVGEGRLLQMNRDGSAPPWSDTRRVLTKVAKP